MESDVARVFFLAICSGEQLSVYKWFSDVWVPYLLFFVTQFCHYYGICRLLPLLRFMLRLADHLCIARCTYVSRLTFLLPFGSWCIFKYASIFHCCISHCASKTFEVCTYLHGDRITRECCNISECSRVKCKVSFAISLLPMCILNLYQ